MALKADLNSYELHRGRIEGLQLALDLIKELASNPIGGNATAESTGEEP